MEVCKTMNITLLGYDENDNLFVKQTRSSTGRHSRAIVLYMAFQHFYIITDKQTIKSLCQVNKTQ
jgi:hypothetical protein